MFNSPAHPRRPTPTALRRARSCGSPRSSAPEGSRFSAPEGRQIVAHGVSRGEVRDTTIPSPAGAAQAPDQTLPHAPESSGTVTALRRFARDLHSDRGSAAVPFILALPIFLWIVAILVQYAIIVNAKLLIDHAAQSAARAAVTSLPEDHPENVAAAAYLSLATLSPLSTFPPSVQADNVYRALQTAGIPAADTFPARYTYAMEATRVDWSPQDPQVDFPTSRGRELDVTVTYRLCLSVPGARGLIGSSDTVAGITGRFLTIASTSRVQTSHSRQSVAGGGGWPQ